MTLKKIAMVTAALLVWLPLHAQNNSADLTDAQMNGKRMFQQRCSICHTPPRAGGKTFGPMLNMETVKGKEMAYQAIIKQGTPRMPGFQYGLEPQEIDNIITYLKTVTKTEAPKEETPAPVQLD